VGASNVNSVPGFVIGDLLLGWENGWNDGTIAGCGRAIFFWDVGSRARLPQRGAAA
jgi:hypothetical protein